MDELWGGVRTPWTPPLSTPLCGIQSIIDKCRICGTEGETIEHIISSCTVLAQSEYKKRHDIFAKIIHQKVVWKMTVTSYILIEQF
jgi:hypothetical protein